jgi:hypothetical protein
VAGVRGAEVSRAAATVHNGVVLTGEWDDDAMLYADGDAVGS